MSDGVYTREQFDDIKRELIDRDAEWARMHGEMMRSLRVRYDQLMHVTSQRDQSNAQVSQLETDLIEYKQLLDRVESERVEAEQQRMKAFHPEAISERDEWKAKCEALQTGVGRYRGMPGLSQVKVRLLHDGAKLPERRSNGASGYDAYACIGSVIYLPPGTRWAVPLGVAIDVPRGYECQIRARSGLARFKGLTILNGVGTIDADYRGELSALVVNHSTQPARVYPGQAIAQLVFAPIETPELVVVDELSDTDRGSGGFGSTDEVRR